MVLPVVYLMGPTATGKTELAAALCCQIPFELINVDAAQVYRQMNIGTAKPDLEFLDNYPHHLIDICTPEVSYNAADFVRDTTKLILNIHGRGNIPLLVGGTFFYFNALENGLSDLPAASQEIRQELEKEIKTKGLPTMHAELASIDSETANKISPNDSKRVQRALEIYRITGSAPSSLMHSRVGLKYPVIKLALFDPDRSALHRRIAQRFSQMLDQGLVEEVKNLLEQYPQARSFASMRTVGYRQVIEFVDGLVDEAEMIERAVAATRQLAKRQLTWLRQQSGVVWIDATQPNLATNVELLLRHHPQMNLVIRS